MMAKTENSMMMALSELRNIEAERLAEEAAQRAAQRRQEEEERRRQEAERLESEQRKVAEEAHQRRVAEAEARLRVVERMRAEELSLKAEQLAHELRVTRVEHGLLTAHIGALEEGSSTVNQRWRWRLLAAVSSCLLVGFAAVLVVGPKLRRVPPPVIVQAPVQVEMPAEKIKEQVDAAVKKRVMAMEQQLLALQKARPTAEPVPVRTPPRRTQAAVQSTGTRTDLARMAEDCKDDPLCGVGAPMGKPTPGRASGGI